MFFYITEETELQCVPGRFESIEEYIRVFEHLLFEEYLAKLYSTWEELTETLMGHVKVCVKNIERRERGITHFLTLFFYVFVDFIGSWWKGH